MKAIVFPGQGSQKVEMGLTHYQSNKVFKQIVDEANEILGYDLKQIMFQGPAETLKQTQHTQPAIFIHSFALYSVLDIEPDMVAGHSLGEFTALAAAKALSFSDALQIVRRRGELMQQAGVDNPGTMAAVIGMEDDAVTDICSRAADKSNSVVNAANFNSPGQVVISGDIEGIDAAIEIAKSEGCRLAKKLPVSGAFHTSLMKPAYKGLKESLEQVEIRQPVCQVYSNFTASATTRSDTIRKNLLNQLMNPVLWTQTIENMKADGADHFVEIGPGNVLQGLIKRTVKEVEIEGYQ